MTAATPNFSELFSKQPTREELAAAFDELEADITYIDDNLTVIYFSPFRIFERPQEILGRNALECHPEKVHKAILDMLESFKLGEKDTVSHDTSSHGRPVKVCYHAMRDADKNYLGCMEVVTYRD